MTSSLELVLHIEHQCQQNNVTTWASLSLVRGLYIISMTHYDVLSLLFKLLNLILYLRTLNSHLCYFLLNIVFLNFFSTYFFDDITLCINLAHVALSNMSHLVYITLFRETDGVTLSRLVHKGDFPCIYIPKHRGPTWKLILNLLISEGGTNSSHTHNLAKSQSYRGLKLLLSDTKSMTTVNSRLIYHRFQENHCMLTISAWHMPVSEWCQVSILKLSN